MLDSVGGVAHLDVDYHELMVAVLPRPVGKRLRQNGGLIDIMGAVNRKRITCGVLRRSSDQSWLLLYLRNMLHCRTRPRRMHDTLDVIARDKCLHRNNGLALSFDQLEETRRQRAEIDQT